MGNNLKKNKKNSKKEFNEKTEENKEEKNGKKKVSKKKIQKLENDENLIKNNPGALVLEDEISSGKINLELLNKQYHSKEKDPIEEIMTHPKFKNSIIIGTKSGKIKLYSNITDFNAINNESILYDSKERIFSMILLKNNNDSIGIGLFNKILILTFNKNEKLEKQQELKYTNIPLKEVNLLELDNSNLISAGIPIIYWVKVNNKYNKTKYVIPNDKGARFINLVEFPEYNTILATQEKTHEIYFIKDNKEKIELIKTISNCPSIWYKGSAQKLSDFFLLLIGKFELNVIDANNGEVCNKYPGIDKGTLLNLTQSYEGNDIWIITDFHGKYFEFYLQEGNDLIYLDIIELDEENEIKYNNKLVRIDNECFVAVNNHGEIFVFRVNIKDFK